MSELHLYNSYTRQKEKFEPITPGHVGLYVCGPTVSGESHLGHARPYITFDIVNRWLQECGYKVRYVRNITDAGHFEEEGREAEDKVGKKAMLEKMEPMEMVHKYTSLFHWGMRAFNNLEPNIEPTATGHIVEQIAMIEDIISKGYAYEVNGSVYFDVKKYAENYPYGKLSGRVLEDLLETTRDLDGQEEKRNKVDFALWKNAPPQHIQRWISPWGEGFPGWHIECSAMSSKYLGVTFDIHGGGMDLLFPHHESEIAQSTIVHDHAPVNYWMHNNMITINGKKMGKSYNNVIKLTELFSGDHPVLEQAYHPMVVRFYILQTHYRSTLDFGNEGLQASEKALRRLWEAYDVLKKFDDSTFNSNKGISDSLTRDSYLRQRLDELPVEEVHTFFDLSLDFEVYLKTQNFSISRGDAIQNTNELQNKLKEYGSEFYEMFLDRYPTYKTHESLRALFLLAISDQFFILRYLNTQFILQKCEECADFMNDDFNTAKVIANLFEIVPIINGLKGGQFDRANISKETLNVVKNTFKTYMEDVLGLQPLAVAESNKLDQVLSLLIQIRKDARTRKDFATSDQIRNELAAAGIMLKDEKDGNITYTIE